MPALEKWNKIVDLYKKHFNANEKTVQSIWESVFAEVFGYSKLSNEIDRHRNVRIGSTERVITDIIIKDGETDLFIVELKQHNFSKSRDMEQQLFSYLKQLKVDTGILICDKIYIYDYDYNKDDDAQINIAIDFIENNSNGISFVELFKKDMNHL